MLSVADSGILHSSKTIMGKKCFVLKCNSGYNACREKVSLFKAPNDVELLKKWQAAIPRYDRILTTKDHVCEKHFVEKDVIKNFTAEYNGIAVVHGRFRPKLVTNAVPSIFPGWEVDARKKMADAKTVDKTPQKPAAEQRIFIENPTSIPSVKIEVVEKATETPVYILPLTDAEIVDSDISEEEVDNSTILFHELKSLALGRKLELPNTSWAAHEVEERGSSYIVFGKVSAISRQRFAMTKHIRFDESLNVEIYGLDVKTELQTFNFDRQPENIEEIEMLIAAVDRKNLCVGGPNDKEFEGIYPEKAFVDKVSKWRHKNCPLWLDDTSWQDCSKCRHLCDSLRIHVKRKQTRTVVKRVRCSSTPTIAAKKPKATTTTSPVIKVFTL